MSTAEHLSTIDHRLDGIDQRLVGVDRRLDGIDHRLDGIGHRLDGIGHRLDGIDQRLDEQRSEFRALSESSRADFNNLFDFVRAQTERADARHSELQAEMRTGFADVHTAIRALAPRVRRAGGRGRR